MRTLTIDETWDYTKRMWKWVAFQKEVLKDERSVDVLKRVWLRKNTPEFVSIQSGCFFCQESRGEGCEGCPGKLVDVNFSCTGTDHNYYSKPGAFYREILRLDEIRTAEPPEHVWEHGDVFKTKHSTPMICLEYYGSKPRYRAFCLKGSIMGPVVCGDTFDNATFLFNIKDKV